LEDARDAYRKALQGGGTQGIKMAGRDLEDARIDRQAYMLENATVKPTRLGMMGGSRAAGTSGYTVVMNGVTINGVQNAKDLLAEIRKLGRQTATQSRGRAPGIGGA
jgi:hypothetical protein